MKIDIKTDWKQGIWVLVVLGLLAFGFWVVAR